MCFIIDIKYVCSISLLPCSSWIPSLKVPPCSCSNLITFSKVVSSIWVELFQPLTVPVWVVKGLLTANVPVTSLTTKWALTATSGGLDATYVKPVSTIFKDLAAPISVVVGITFVPVPEVVVTVAVGKSV